MGSSHLLKNFGMAGMAGMVGASSLEPVLAFMLVEETQLLLVAGTEAKVPVFEAADLNAGAWP